MSKEEKRKVWLASGFRGDGFMARHKVLWMIAMATMSVGLVAEMVFGAPHWVRLLGAGVSMLAWVVFIWLYVRDVLRRSKS